MNAIVADLGAYIERAKNDQMLTIGGGQIDNLEIDDAVRMELTRVPVEFEEDKAFYQKVSTEEGP